MHVSYNEYILRKYFRKFDKIATFFLKVEKNGRTPRLLPSLTIDQILNIQETSSYVNTHMNEILTEAFINMFAVNPDIQDKFFKDYIGDVQNESDQEDNRKSLLFLGFRF